MLAARSLTGCAHTLTANRVTCSATCHPRIPQRQLNRADDPVSLGNAVAHFGNAAAAGSVGGNIEGWAAAAPAPGITVSGSSEVSAKSSFVIADVCPDGIQTLQHARSAIRLVSRGYWSKNAVHAHPLSRGASRKCPRPLFCHGPGHAAIGHLLHQCIAWQTTVCTESC